MHDVLLNAGNEENDSAFSAGLWHPGGHPSERR